MYCPCFLSLWSMKKENLTEGNTFSPYGKTKELKNMSMANKHYLTYSYKNLFFN